MGNNAEDDNSPRSLKFSPVMATESGRKLIRFLEGRLGLPEALLQRWIRTGQIRVNGGRRKPFDRVAEGDIVRLPPFAMSLAEQTGAYSTLEWRPECGLPPLLDSANDIWALNKPAGLPTQSGTGHSDSVAARLAACYADSSFRPAPCHRLDRDTSGVLLVGAAHAALSQTQEAFRKGAVHKEYLAWTEGRWPWSADRLLHAWLRRERMDDSTKIRVLTKPLPYAREAWTIVRPLLTESNRSLLQVRPLSGRMHQIRAQLAHAGFPVIGDGKYGRKTREKLHLHSLRIILPDGDEFSCLPDWAGIYSCRHMPDPLHTDQAVPETAPGS